LSTSGSTEETLAVDESGETRPARPASVLAAGDVVGRYVILAKLGAGAMGVVHAAYDPELDRKVALKLLRRSPERGVAMTEGRSRLLGEAQALAKFSHPEIVAVYDVGEHHGSVWLAMEFVDGQTLGAWAKQTPRSWKEVVQVMRAVGRGVAAAHAAGLVHRDLKPDNVMIDKDGRVRVMDFGLTEPAARADPRGLHGTPAYMAPEQFAGGEVTAASDQFAYCVTMWELLHGQRPFVGETIAELAASVLDGRMRGPPRDRKVPSWLRRICERGLARESARRWPSMQALLTALDRAESRVRVRRGVVALGVIAGLAVGVEGWRRFEHAQSVASCEAAGASIEELWNDDARERVRQGLLATRVGYADATVTTVMPYLDAQAQAWRQHRTDTCLRAEVEARWDAATLDRATWCLDERRMELESLITALEQADTQIVRTAVNMATSLTTIEPCVDERVLANLPEPPARSSRAEISKLRAELARAQMLLFAGKYSAGLEVIRPARMQAKQLDWPPLIAAAAQLEGALLMQSGEFAAAEAMGIEAYLEAAKASAWELAADAAIDLTEVVGERQARFTEGRVWASHARVAIHHAGDPLHLREARLASNLGHLELIAGRYDEVEVLYERALEVWTDLLGPEHPLIGTMLADLGTLHRYRLEPAEARKYHERSLALREHALGSEHPDIATALHNLGMVLDELGEHEQAEQLLERAIATWERTLGLEHPNAAVTMTSLGNLAYRRADYDRAKQQYARSLAIMERVIGPEHPDIASLLNNLANVAHEQGELDQAKQLHQRALSINEQLGPEHPSVAISLYNVAMLHVTLGELTQAQPLLERALTIAEKVYGLDHPETAWLLGELGDIEVQLGQPEAALPLLERALIIFDAHEGEQGGEPIARFALARALVDGGADRERAQAEAERAREGFRQLGASASQKLARVESWLAELD
jgi:tetratricopeptide (TPR) repeat protein